MVHIMHDYEVIPIDPRRALAVAQIHLGYSRDLTSGRSDEAHFGGLRDRSLVGVAVIHPEGWIGGPHVAWRISAVAVEPENRGRGLGLRLVEQCLDHALTSKGDVVWCRSSYNAVGFFHRLGFASVSETVSDGRTVLMYRKVLGPYRSWTTP